MKRLFPLLFLCGSAFSATWDQLPLAVGLHGADPKIVQSGIGKSHPWKPGDALPASFKDAGLDAPVKLVACDIYLDGGSRYYIFRGSNDRFLLLCTDSGMSFSPETKKVSKVEQPRVYLAAAHFGSKSKVEVPADSATEQFLLSAIMSEVARISAAQKN